MMRVCVVCVQHAEDTDPRAAGRDGSHLRLHLGTTPWSSPRTARELW